ncbi:uncharacterized protein TNCV_2433421 [Trichonephila clavipes]|nr:uncharacterized protein TNCV_2433421 [Trichonephila clavipes]
MCTALAAWGTLTSLRAASPLVRLVEGKESVRRWSPITELSNRHSPCRAVSSSIGVAGAEKREDTARPRASLRFSMEIRSGKYAGHAIREIPSVSR